MLPLFLILKRSRIFSHKGRTQGFCPYTGKCGICSKLTIKTPERFPRPLTIISIALVVVVVAIVIVVVVVIIIIIIIIILLLLPLLLL